MTSVGPRSVGAKAIADVFKPQEFGASQIVQREFLLRENEQLAHYDVRRARQTWPNRVGQSIRRIRCAARLGGMNDVQIDLVGISRLQFVTWIVLQPQADHLLTPGFEFFAKKAHYPSQAPDKGIRQCVAAVACGKPILQRVMMVRMDLCARCPDAHQGSLFHHELPGRIEPEPAHLPAGVIQKWQMQLAWIARVLMIAIGLRQGGSRYHLDEGLALKVIVGNIAVVRDDYRPLEGRIAC